MPVGNGREKTKGRSLDVLSAIKKIIVVVKAAFLCLAHALVIAMARVNSDPKYELYRHGKGLNKHVEDLLKASGVDLSNGGGLEELEQFQNYLLVYKIVVFDGLNPIGSFSVEIPFRQRNCTCFMIRTMGTTM
jgi:hypothetical protein